MVVNDKQLEAYVKRIHQKAIKAGDIDREVWRTNYKELTRGLQEGWGKDFATIAYDQPNWKYIAELKYHTASFAAFKNHEETGRIASLLTGSDGQPLHWKQFRDEALKVSELYNKVWLQTEFNHAHQSARMASKWKDFEDNVDLYPNLEYVAVMDDRTRPDHAELHGAIYPINDSFWDTYYPPNDWGCRCSVRQTDATPVKAKALPDMRPGFSNNPGKSGKVWDAKGAYYKGVGAKDRKEIDKITERFTSFSVRKEVIDLVSDTKIKVPDSNIAFTLSRQMIKDITAPKKGHANRYIRNTLIYYIKNISNEAKFIKKAPEQKIKGKVKNRIYVEWYYYEVATPYPEKFYLNYALRKDGKYELHSITDVIKKREI